MMRILQVTRQQALQVIGTRVRRAVVLPLVMVCASQVGGTTQATRAADIPLCMLHTIVGSPALVATPWDPTANIPLSMLHVITVPLPQMSAGTPIRPVLASITGGTRDHTSSGNAAPRFPVEEDETAGIPLSMLHIIVGSPDPVATSWDPTANIPLFMLHTISVQRQ